MKIFFLLGFFCAARLAAQAGTDVIAKAGQTMITAREFRERFELLPRRLTPADLDQVRAKEELIVSLLAEKLLAQEALKEGWDDDPIYRKEIEAVRRLLARDALYRREVQNAVRVDSSELAEGLRNVRRQLFVAYVFAEERADLQEVSTQADAGSRDRVQVTGSTETVLCDTVTVRWGEAEAALEDVVFSLKDGEQSEPVASSLGWFVCRVIREERNPEALRLGSRELRERVLETLRLRKEEKRLDEFVRDIMKAADGRARGPAFRAISSVLRTYGEEHPSFLIEGLSGSARNALRADLDSLLTEPLLVMKDERVSIEEAIDRLISIGYRPPALSYPDLERSLSGVLRIWTWQHILEKEAIARGLDADPEVTRQLQMWKDHYLAEAVRRRISGQQSTTDLELFAARAFTMPGSVTPQASIEFAWSKDEQELASWVNDGQADQDRLTVSTVRQDSVDIHMLGELGERLWSAGIDRWTMPVRRDTGYVSARLLNPIRSAYMSDQERDSLRDDVRARKTRRAETVLTARLAAMWGYAVFGDRLRALDVSSVPMMTFRLLGFGGRMFAVPFVRTRTDWIDLEQERILP